MEQVRDLLIVGCHAGLRYSDINRFSPENIDMRNKLIYFTQKKVHQLVIIPMIDYIPKLMKKYVNNLPKMHLNIYKKLVKEVGIDNPIITIEKEETGKFSENNLNLNRYQPIPYAAGFEGFGLIGTGEGYPRGKKNASGQGAYFFYSAIIK